MRAILPLIRKDLRRKLRAPVHLVLTLSFPLALLAIIGLAFRPSGGGGTGLPPIPLVVENRDGAFLGNLIGSGLRNERLADFFDVEIVEPESGEAIVAEGDAAALLILPAGLTDSLLAGGTAELVLVKDPGGVILPQIVESGAELFTLVLSTGSRVLREPLGRVRSMLEGDEWPADERVSEVAVLFQDGFRSADRLLLPPATKVERTTGAELRGEEEDESDPGFNIFAWLFPGMVVLGLLFVGQSSMNDLLREREEGHLKRLLSSPAPVGSIVFSKLLSTLVLLFFCHLLLAAVAGPLFRIEWGNLPATFLLVLAEGLAVTGLVALLFSFTHTERQANALSSVVILGMSLMGGSMVPVEFFPGGMQAISRATLNYWAIDAFREVMVRGGGTANILPHLFLLGAFGAGTAALSSVLLARNIRRGG